MNPLPPALSISADRQRRLTGLIDRTAIHPPRDLANVIRDELRIDLSTRYAGQAIPHPFGKASGQLSCTLSQVADDLDAGIAFVVLKTVIAEDARGSRSMGAWATSETRMRVEKRRSMSGRDGWTVTWTGRGWQGSLDGYLDFATESMVLGEQTGVPIVPSVKFHLPTGGTDYEVAEYRHTTRTLEDAWRSAGAPGALIMEKDFSPTLAGDSRASDRGDVLRWLTDVPRLIQESSGQGVRLGVKVMNALFDDAFQLEMLERLTPTPNATDSPVAFLVVFNRLYDPVEGVAFGGWDLSERNLRVLEMAREAGVHLPPCSATGNICSGRVMAEYARRGCENGQIHTFFQLPNQEYIATGGNRTARALFTLLLHPGHGLVPWLWHLNETGELPERDGQIHFADLVKGGA